MDNSMMDSKRRVLQDILAQARDWKKQALAKRLDVKGDSAPLEGSPEEEATETPGEEAGEKPALEIVIAPGDEKAEPGEAEKAPDDADQPMDPGNADKLRQLLEQMKNKK